MNPRTNGQAMAMSAGVETTTEKFPEQERPELRTQIGHAGISLTGYAQARALTRTQAAAVSILPDLFWAGATTCN